MHRPVLLMTQALLFVSLAHAQSVRSLVNGGNSLYDENKFADAEVNYRKALEKDVSSLPGTYNLGNSLYKQNKFDESIKVFEDAIHKAEARSAKAKAFYNLGDSYLKSQQYEEAVKALTESLKLNPGDKDAQYNLSYALTKLRDRQQDQKNGKNQDKNKDQKNQDQNKQDQNNQDQDRQDKDKQGQQKQNDQQQQQQQQNPQQQQERTMSKADAERILDVLRNSEKEVQKKLRQRAAGRAKTDKDW
jgi:Ca-activated chloride channel family protein